MRIATWQVPVDEQAPTTDWSAADIDAGSGFADTPRRHNYVQRRKAFRPPWRLLSSADLAEYCREAARRAKAAAGELALALGEQKNAWLRELAAVQLRSQTADLLAAKRKDIGAAPALA